jgi:2'-5' RNA ligase
MTRLFIAVEIPEEIKERLVACRGGVEGARWQAAEQLHLTLRFIGEVGQPQEADIRAVLAGLRFPPFAVTLDGLGLFGKVRKPRALWVGVGDPAPLQHLHDKINQSLVRAGFLPEERKFTPHVTLARFRGRARRLEDFLEAYAGFSLPAFVVNSFALFSSHLSHTGAQYRVEESFPAQSDST